MSASMRRKITDFVWITLGSIPYAAGVALFLDPNDLVPGGVTGISILLNRFVPIETGTLILLLNVPILLLGMWKFGWKFLVSTGYALLVISILTNLAEPIGALSEDRLLSTIVGAVLMGLGIGVIFRHRATTGGIDIIVKIVRQKLPHLKTGSLFLVIDSVVILAAGLVFGDVESMIYALIAVLITMQTLDLVLYGRDEAGFVFIISERAEEIAKRILSELEVGVTKLSGIGAYSQKEKEVLMCVVPKKQTLRIEDIVKETDAGAFLILSHAKEIYGEGYKSLFEERL